MNKLKEMLNSISNQKEQIIKEVIRVLRVALPFILMDVVIRVFTLGVSYSRKAMLLPSALFSILWILFFVLLSLSMKRKIGRIIYAICFGFFFIMFFVNIVYYPYTEFFFSFNLLLMASEGSSYVLDTIINTNPVIFGIAFVVLVVGVITIMKFPRKLGNHYKRAGVITVLFVAFHMVVPFFYGSANAGLEWDTWRNPRNVYQNFNDSNKSIKVSGFYEYTLRDFYMTFLKPEEEANPEHIEFLDSEFEEITMHEENEYTGIFEGKNVIFLQLEGIDSWLLNKEDMPNLYALLNNSIVFNNHYSYYNGGGSTFNSELAVNTGLITPISTVRNAYTFSSNLFTNSMPKVFKAFGYRVNAFHMNKGEYYSRKLNYQNWGYDNYYGLLDVKKYDDLSYELDRELILNETFYEKMFQQGQPFVNYVITYTPHTPYNTIDGKGYLLGQEKYGETVPLLSEEETARLYASETDKMVGLLMQALEDNGLIDNTVIVAYADHYMYTLSDKTILDQYKQTENNLINHTPFFIWSNDMERVNVNKVTSQIDILPTVLNLFGIQYKEEYYIGNDAFDKNYKGYVFFSDYSWYDGNIYVESGEIVNGATADPKYVEEMNQRITELIQKNDYVLIYDYFR